MESLTRTWAAEFAESQVRVNAVAPGPCAGDEVAVEDQRAEAAQVADVRSGVSVQHKQVGALAGGHRAEVAHPRHDRPRAPPRPVRDAASPAAPKGDCVVALSEMPVFAG
ncbi:SDR family oxidoreductase [Streptomyces sp. MH60]|uniref:SDR family oxidoreductase n=1 Tax=Streptomyces sp. MH60 TaxID=1940758 RepID=UPI00406BFC3E